MTPGDPIEGARDLADLNRRLQAFSDVLTGLARQLRRDGTALQRTDPSQAVTMIEAHRDELEALIVLVDRFRFGGPSPLSRHPELPMEG